MSAPWQVIKDRLVANGDMTEQSVTRTPKPRHCRDCGRIVIAAITDLGFEVAVEPSATTTLGELTALMNGGETYALLAHGEMVWRSQHRIAYANPDTERTHAMHECGKSPPEINTLFNEAKPRIEYTDSIPF